MMSLRRRLEMIELWLDGTFGQRMTDEQIVERAAGWGVDGATMLEIFDWCIPSRVIDSAETLCVLAHEVSRAKGELDGPP